MTADHDVLDAFCRAHDRRATSMAAMPDEVRAVTGGFVVHQALILPVEG
ncbi:MAG TPA: hypothetical protein VK925_12565 [Jiangellaceae bacterium]|nr:hypothetical protein [Jiangellaceae bacterium]